ncbi:DUF6644 family protein [Aurantiacibacter rhizosphaerae]|uniref:DUF6644 domain-containing protein n=1 Tax=Aurantiacibacter rhizosphaerae TaxID=2691582 RepID=A0A844XAQ8_9SPHN|nr:DUF6644 family protein [Aurantiacibacter rhizosphaerae]MWV26859.1 hypothetical protein [Aurantiacibacter rhizosphaerae]
MSIATFADGLYATSFSTALRETTWIIPDLQAVHILAISVVIGSALITELRFAGILATDRPAPDVLRRYLPWMRAALWVLLATGILLVIAEPQRTLGNVVFWLKMVLVAGASLVTIQARKGLLRSSAGTNEAAAHETSRGLAFIMLLVWCAVIFCGRFIAYT